MKLTDQQIADVYVDPDPLVEAMVTAVIITNKLHNYPLFKEWLKTERTDEK